MKFVTGIGVHNPIAGRAGHKVAVVIPGRIIWGGGHDIYLPPRVTFTVFNRFLPIGHLVHAPRIVEDDQDIGGDSIGHEDGI